MSVRFDDFTDPALSIGLQAAGLAAAAAISAHGVAAGVAALQAGQTALAAASTEACENDASDVENPDYTTDSNPLVAAADASGRFACSDCGKTFINSGHLYRHVLVHSDKRDFECPHPGCGKRFRRRDNMRRHADGHLAEESLDFECDEPMCGKRFATSARLRRHRRSHDPATAGHPCGECGAVFRKKRHRAKHVHHAHGAPLPFGCTHAGCGERFPLRSLRRKHERKAHLEQIFICPHPECAELAPFSAQGDIDKHLREEHLRNQCDVCGRVCHGPAALAAHREVHTVPLLDRYRFACEKCDSCYTRKSNLQAHMRAKHDGRAFLCTDCPARLATRLGLTNHYVKKHGLDEDEARARSGQRRIKRARRQGPGDAGGGVNTVKKVMEGTRATAVTAEPKPNTASADGLEFLRDDVM